MELIDVLDEKGSKTGKTKTRADIHRDGDWHRTVHVWFINSKKELLLQRRSKNMEVFPNKWHISVGGHINSREDEISAALRETKEEIGIDLLPEELNLIGIIKEEGVLNNGTYFDNEFCNVYFVNKDLNIENLKNNPEEITELQWISSKEFEKWSIEKNPELVPQNEYPLVVKSVKNLTL